ncbi:MAG: 16S rRNA (cytidine(1402)-2'-O)-methyltransferase [Firmicutes bacterium]|nr:16S rRNA (cytidine(1402)-2'-O)-methyltransferase [Bacillota bacterium]
MVKEDGCLYLVGTPIGNLEDISLRAVRILSEVDLIACEDTRETLKLLNHLGISKKMISYQKYSENEKKSYLIDLVEAGNKLALVSDAGMPGISDPGEILVREAWDRGVRVEVIPGPSAVISGLVISGLSTSNFYFHGFLPKGKVKEREGVVTSLKDMRATLIFYITPHSVEKDLALLLKILGNRNGAIAREITKFYEEVIRGTLEELLQIVGSRTLKGEMILIIDGNQETAKEMTLEEQYKLYQIMLGSGVKSKEAIKTISADYNVSKNKLYEYILGKKEE